MDRTVRNAPAADDAGEPLADAAVSPANANGRLRRGRYISDSILERRRRMLEVAKAMIAEGGPEGFTIRELGRRANVSVTTIYATYGDKEGLIAAAIQDYYDRLPVASAPASSTISGVLRAIELVRGAILANKPYARQYAALFFNTTDPRVYKAILDTATASAGQLPWLQKIMRDGDIIPGLTLEMIAHLLANHRLMVLHDWAEGRISDENLATATKRSFLIMARGVTRGPTHARIETELKKLLRASDARSAG